MIRVFILWQEIVFLSLKNIVQFQLSQLRFVDKLIIYNMNYLILMQAKRRYAEGIKHFSGKLQSYISEVISQKFREMLSQAIKQ